MAPNVRGHPVWSGTVEVGKLWVVVAWNRHVAVVLLVVVRLDRVWSSSWNCLFMLFYSKSRQAEHQQSNEVLVPVGIFLHAISAVAWLLVARRKLLSQLGTESNRGTRELGRCCVFLGFEAGFRYGRVSLCARRAGNSGVGENTSPMRRSRRQRSWATL